MAGDCTEWLLWHAVFRNGLDNLAFTNDNATQHRTGNCAAANAPAVAWFATWKKIYPCMGEFLSATLFCIWHRRYGASDRDEMAGYNSDVIEYHLVLWMYVLLSIPSTAINLSKPGLSNLAEKVSKSAFISNL